VFTGYLSKFATMKSLWIKLLPLLFVIAIAACKNNASKNTDKVFQHPALKGLTEEIDKNPKDAGLYYKRGRALHNLELDSLALTDFKKAVSLDSSKGEYFSAVGDLMFEHKDIAGSLPWIEHAIKLNPKDESAHLKLAKLFFYTKDYTKAFAEINTVLRQDVYNPEGYFLKGMIYKDLKDTAHAVSSFQTAVQVAPDYREAVVQLGLMYSMKKDVLALQYFDNAFKLDSNDVFPLFAKGVFYQNMNDFETAKQAYTKVILTDRDYTDAYLNMGYILLQQDSVEKAKRQFDLVTQLQPDDAEAYYNRGLCSELMGNKQEAIKDYEQALVFAKDYKEPAEGLKRLKK
jgi:tetratricopeptide (TPR) repeat protein